MAKYDFEKGQSLIEIIIGLTIAVIFIVTAVAAVSTILPASKTNRDMQTATFLAAQLAEEVKTFTDSGWHNIYDLNKGPAAHYYLGIATPNSSTIQGAQFSTGRELYLSCANYPLTNKIYCLGGGDGFVGALREITEYNPVTNALITKSDQLLFGRYSFPCDFSPATNKIYCFGGYRGSSNYTNEIVEYDPATGAVTPKIATLPTARRGLSCVTSSINNKIYCFGGDDDSTLYNQILEYDPANDQLVNKAPTALPTARGYLSCAQNPSTGKIYCFGGSGSKLRQIVEYDPSTNILIIKTGRLPSGTTNLSCAPDPSTSKIFCFGGNTDTQTLDEIVEYDPVADSDASIRSRMPYPAARLSCAASPAANRIFCFGGFNSGASPSLLSALTQYTTPYIPGYFYAIPGDETINTSSTTFTRYFYIEDARRDALGNIVTSGGTDDPSTQKITTVIDWPGNNTGFSFSEYSTRSRNAVYQQTDWSGGSGQEGPVTTVNNKFAASTDIDFSTTPGSIQIFGAPPQADLTSSIFDTQVASGTAINTIMWQGSLPSSAVVQFQIASSNCANGASNPPTCSSGTWSYRGPNGSGVTYYTPTNANIPLVINPAYHNNQRYFRYKVFLQLGLGQNPRVDDVIIGWSP